MENLIAPAKPEKLQITAEEETEIVIVSDTVRQRRARTPSSNSPTKEDNDSSRTTDSQQNNNSQVGSANNLGSQQQLTNAQSQKQQVLPDLLPPQTFRLAESSALFSQISMNPDADIPPAKPSKRKSGESQAQMVEIKVKNIGSDKMSVQLAAGLEPQQGEIVDTVNILESVEPFVPEYVETVQIVDLSEDSDSSMRVDADGKEVKRSKSKRSLNDSPKVVPEEPEFDKDVELRLGPNQTSTPILRVEKQRISFEEKRKRIETERDILRDSEEEGDAKTTGVFKQPKAKRWRQLQMAMEELDNSMAEQEARNSFYNPDKDLSFEVEPLVFSDDEDIPRFSMEMTQPLDSDDETVWFVKI